MESSPVQDLSSPDADLCSVLHRLRMHFSPHILCVRMRGLASVASCNMKEELLTECEKAADVFH